MRYKIIILLLLLSSKLTLKAQVEPPIEAPLQQQNVDTDEKIKTKLGVKFTLGGHTFLGNAFDKAKPMYGFGAGAYQIIDLDQKKNIQLQWELNLTFKGSKFGKPTDTSNTYFSKISLSYAELPLYIGFKLTDDKNPLYILMGAQIGYLFKSSITQGLGQYGEVLHNNLPFKRIDFSPALGFRKSLGSGISVQFTGKYGYSNIYSSKFISNPAYINVFPQFKDGTRNTHNLSFELAFMF